MKILIVDDDFTSRLLLQEILKSFGSVHIAANGPEAIEAVQLGLDAQDPYRLICLDILMPGLDGQTVLRRVRALEESKGIISTQGACIVVTSALGNMKSVMEAFRGLCDDYLVKPVDRAKMLEIVRRIRNTDSAGISSGIASRSAVPG